MGFFALGIPVETVLPLSNSMAGIAAGAARPLIGLGIFAALLVLFRPLLAGLMRAALLLLSPRRSLEERRARAHMRDVIEVSRLARALENQHPSLAAELRAMSLRG